LELNCRRDIQGTEDMDNKVVLFEDRNNCCGCSACYAICPVGAISMEPDDEGFLYPAIDDSKCIACHQCQAVCAFGKDRSEKGTG
jgi:formate hydrogenlyase subunit 6/NADH:ubiquinone oxidoreductase subunit I